MKWEKEFDKQFKGEIKMTSPSGTIIQGNYNIPIINFISIQIEKAKQERDKEIINRLDIILTDPNDYLRGGIENLKTFINKKHD